MSKVFDQHPRTFSYHEPEKLLPGPLRQRLYHNSDTEVVAEFINGVFACRGLRAMRKRPIVAKTYRSDMAHLLRKGYIYGLSAAETALPSALIGGLVNERTSVPDMGDLSDATLVAKCVSLEFTLPKILAEERDVKFIYIVRHPCGQIHSHMNGIKAGKMYQHYLPPRSEMKKLFSFDKPVDDLVEDDFSQLEINSYRWAVSVDVSLRSIETHPNVKLIRYEDLCEDPAEVFSDAFEWVGLDWHRNCAEFIEASLQQPEDGADYHALVRNPKIAAEKWRKAMAGEDIETVRHICSQTGAAKLYPDLQIAPSEATSGPATA